MEVGSERTERREGESGARLGEESRETGEEAEAGISIPKHVRTPKAQPVPIHKPIL